MTTKNNRNGRKEGAKNLVAVAVAPKKRFMFHV